MKNKKFFGSLIFVLSMSLLMTIVSSCLNVDKGNDEVIKESSFEYHSGVWNSMDYKIEEKEIDSCQYIVILGVDGRNIIHKANCRNVAHNPK